MAISVIDSFTGNLIIPDSVTKIGRCAFEDDTNLMTITFNRGKLDAVIEENVLSYSASKVLRFSGA